MRAFWNACGALLICLGLLNLSIFLLGWVGAHRSLLNLLVFAVCTATGVWLMRE